MEEQLFNVDQDSSGERLDRFLCARLAGYSRSRVQRAIGEDLVSIDGVTACKTGLRVKEGQEIIFRPPPPQPVTALAEDLPLDVLYEDEDLLVINKAAGMVVHPAPGHPCGTVVNAVLGRCPEMCQPGSLRPGIVHRLDRGTSGAIVVAKSDSARSGLSEQFLARKVFKGYLAICFGSPSDPEGRIVQPIERAHGDRKRFTSRTEAGRRAVTLWRSLLAARGLSLLSIRILTGRTHQIRVHLTDRGHPIVGDDLYCAGWPKQVEELRHCAQRRELWVSPLLAPTGEGEPERASGSRADLVDACSDGPLLHAALLGFEHPATGEQMVFSAPPPLAFRTAVRWMAGGLGDSLERTAADMAVFEIGG